MKAPLQERAFEEAPQGPFNFFLLMMVWLTFKILK
ncbi:hypothetical protein BN12_23 [Paenibacillus phage BN12]|uniref:Uncharacterized protein n=1 Tax=Paenibacillus phage BN12 TaxID=2070189 RepID=A0A2I7SCI2_9CAUD|nr:hypothetical protein HWB43_gp23 [Paenibacillus phage BN12]AUS03576.1 hypothetical protein BN12_23 [Paenibacillus phage BN12]